MCEFDITRRVAGGLEYRVLRLAPTGASRATAYSRLRRVRPIQAWMIHAWRHACLDPGPSGGRAHWVVCHLLPYISLAMEKQLPPERVVLCIQHSKRFPLSCLLVML